MSMLKEYYLQPNAPDPVLPASRSGEMSPVRTLASGVLAPKNKAAAKAGAAARTDTQAG